MLQLLLLLVQEEDKQVEWKFFVDTIFTSFLELHFRPLPLHSALVQQERTGSNWPIEMILAVSNGQKCTRL